MQTDVEIIAKTIYGEARSEHERGMQAVATVIYNRSHGNVQEFAKTCLKPKQFSVWNNVNDIEIKEPKPYTIALKIARTMMDKVFTPYPFKINPPTNYCTVKLYNENPPYWAIGRPSEIIGNHIFFS